MFKGLDAFQLEGKLGYIPEKDRIYLQGAEFESDFEVFVRLIPDTTSLEPDDNIPAPVDMEVNIIQLALQILATQMQVPRDNQNDGV
jgi:hypothetical protein